MTQRQETIKYICLGCIIACKCEIDKVCAFIPVRCLDEKISKTYGPDWREQ